MEVITKVSYWLDKRKGLYRLKKTRHEVTYLKTYEEVLAEIKNAKQEVDDVSEQRIVGKSPVG